MMQVPAGKAPEIQIPMKMDPICLHPMMMVVVWVECEGEGVLVDVVGIVAEGEGEGVDVVVVAAEGDGKVVLKHDKKDGANHVVVVVLVAEGVVLAEEEVVVEVLMTLHSVKAMKMLVVVVWNRKERMRLVL